MNSVVSGGVIGVRWRLPFADDQDVNVVNGHVLEFARAATKYRGGVPVSQELCWEPVKIETDT